MRTHRLIAVAALAAAFLALDAVAHDAGRGGEPVPAAQPPTAAPAGTPQSGPPVPGKWEPILEFTDEFGGDRIDAAKWNDHNPTWIGRKPGLFMPKNVTVADGFMHIAMRREGPPPGSPAGYHTYTCGAVRSKGTVLYGYFEARCRAMKSRGSSAFWFYDQSPKLWTEIDVFEIGGAAPGHEQKIHMNVHVFRTPEEGEKHWSKPSTWEAPWRPADDFHVYGLLWDRDQIVWYVDGTERYRQKNTHWRQPLTLNFDSETMPEWFGLPEEGTLPSTFSADYVRAWRRAD